MKKIVILAFLALILTVVGCKDKRFPNNGIFQKASETESPLHMLVPEKCVVIAVDSSIKEMRRYIVQNVADTSKKWSAFNSEGLSIGSHVRVEFYTYYPYDNHNISPKDIRIAIKE